MWRKLIVWQQKPNRDVPQKLIGRPRNLEGKRKTLGACAVREEHQGRIARQRGATCHQMPASAGSGAAKNLWRLGKHFIKKIQQVWILFSQRFSTIALKVKSVATM
jgi:hypothetical protein